MYIKYIEDESKKSYLCVFYFNTAYTITFIFLQLRIKIYQKYYLYRFIDS